MFKRSISIHPPRAGRDRVTLHISLHHADFNPPAPCGAGLAGLPPLVCWLDISIHPPRAGRDLLAIRSCALQTHFNPPAPCGAGRQKPNYPHSPGGISIHPPRAGRDAVFISLIFVSHISIHPPRAGRDGYTLFLIFSIDNFNPPAPCGAGLSLSSHFSHSISISIHPPRAGRDYVSVSQQNIGYISIHPPRAGRDEDGADPRQQEQTFQSTRPVRGGTEAAALGDAYLGDFNPPAPCGAGRIRRAVQISRGAISIHPPRAGRDLTQSKLSDLQAEFQSTRPVRGGTFGFDKHLICSFLFQSTRPVRGGTLHRTTGTASTVDFNPPAPCGAGP